MNIENLREMDVASLKQKVEEIKKENPLVTSEVYKMDNISDVISRLDSITEKLLDLERKFDRTFDGNGLINGRFVDVARVCNNGGTE